MNKHDKESAPTPEPALVTTEQLSMRLGVPVRTIRYWMQRKRIPFLKLAGPTSRAYFEPEKVRDALSRYTREAAIG